MNHRYDFIYLFDATDANPNGDPDAGNLPRLDTETGQGLITDVCLKRKIRNYVQIVKPECQDKDVTGSENWFDIYVREKAVLNQQHAKAYKACGLKPEAKKLPKDLADAKQIKDWMCRNFFDIRTFGAVMTTDVNSGQVRGPVQIAFSRSVDRVVTSEHAVTRMAVTTEEEAKKQQGDNRTMGRKFTIPYALYRAHGTINPLLARRELADGRIEGTGFTEGINRGEKNTNSDDDSDLELLFTALENAFQHDASAARPAGSMAPRALLVFRHDGTGPEGEQKTQQAKLGCAASHALFERLKIKSFDEQPSEGGKPPRSFDAYSSRITFDDQPLIKPGESKDLGNGVTIIRRI